MVDRALDRDGLAAFLRGRREVLQPEDVGLRRGARRRTAGLRREEVAELCDMSVDYLARLERGSGSQPSHQMAAAIARGLRLTPDERDHLFLLCGHRLQPRHLRDAHISPGLLRVMDRLQDTPAQIVGPIGETLQQTPPAVALLGDETRHSGPARSALYRWFTDSSARRRYLPADHDLHSRVYVAILRAAATAQGPGSPAALLVPDLQQQSKEFAELWNRQEVGLRWSGAKRFVHPQVGRIDLYCQTLLDPDQGQSLLIFTATPGTEDHEKLALLAVLGADTFTPSRALDSSPGTFRP
ncbi:helix-turn-helix transcriptional regulator [Actinoplanes utahensis]|uniref:XRE family transcriptional regulator n=1 Tax=Actinoplanes utahensis TaxID=1869 RepID=A0A0A6UJY9_ACTUT|nr:helix-turn-helix transcriptional regulator [Actinoplanes utahensis]KHD75368.1 XRE family transcriptional regulator [Actinoplanes utahensis]GIF33722.1 transcriptional regulator [Actinoplanes utahensis]